MASERTHKLILHIEVPEIPIDDLAAMVEEDRFADDDELHAILIGIAAEAGLCVNVQGCGIEAYKALIVGAEFKPVPQEPDHAR